MTAVAIAGQPAAMPRSNPRGKPLETAGQHQHVAGLQQIGNVPAPAQHAKAVAQAALQRDALRRRAQWTVAGNPEAGAVQFPTRQHRPAPGKGQRVLLGLEIAQLDE